MARSAGTELMYSSSSVSRPTAQANDAQVRQCSVKSAGRLRRTGSRTPVTSPRWPLGSLRGFALTGALTDEEQIQLTSELGDDVGTVYLRPAFMRRG